MATIKTSRISEASPGKTSTTSVRRAISRSSARADFVDCGARPARVEGQHVGFGVLEQRGDLRQPALEMDDSVAQSPAELIAVRGGEDPINPRTVRQAPRPGTGWGAAPGPPRGPCPALGASGGGPGARP